VARELFKKAITAAGGIGNFGTFTNGFTYKMLGWKRSEPAEAGEVRELVFERAAKESCR